MVFELKPLGISVGTVFCVGRNYAAHAKELGNAVPSEPVVFLKPASALVHSGARIVRPSMSNRVDHEVEVVVALGKGGRGLSVERALDCVAGYAVGIDVTARDLQEVAKKKALPWAVSKGFDTFAPVSDFVAPALIGDGPIEVALTVNGALRQKGSTAQMLFPIPQLISYLSTIFTLHPGDLIFTGTPEGVAPLQKGDVCVATLQGDRARLEVTVE
jgi:2-keto-4-pentenoate hydratase/2-oxohepta-3-ene-1,7-dioic acid hydratase in catechol pathway